MVRNRFYGLQDGRQTGLSRIHRAHLSRLLGLRRWHSALVKASVDLLSYRPSDCWLRQAQDRI